MTALYPVYLNVESALQRLRVDRQRTRSTPREAVPSRSGEGQ